MQVKWDTTVGFVLRNRGLSELLILRVVVMEVLSLNHRR